MDSRKKKIRKNKDANLIFPLTSFLFRALFKKKTKNKKTKNKKQKPKKGSLIFIFNLV
jgi:hypothetical protein